MLEIPFKIRYCERGLPKSLKKGNFKCGKCGKEGKYKKCEYLQNEKSFLDEIKNTFHSF